MQKYGLPNKPAKASFFIKYSSHHQRGDRKSSVVFKQGEALTLVNFGNGGWHVYLKRPRIRTRGGKRANWITSKIHIGWRCWDVVWRQILSGASWKDFPFQYLSLSRILRRSRNRHNREHSYFDDELEILSFHRPKSWPWDGQSMAQFGSKRMWTENNQSGLSQLSIAARSWWGFM